MTYEFTDPGLNWAWAIIPAFVLVGWPLLIWIVAFIVVRSTDRDPMGWAAPLAVIPAFCAIAMLLASPGFMGVEYHDATHEEHARNLASLRFEHVDLYGTEFDGAYEGAYVRGVVVETSHDVYTVLLTEGGAE